MSEQEFSDEDVARYWDGDADLWADEVCKGRDIARERLNNPAFLAFIGDLRGKQVLDAGCGETLSFSDSIPAVVRTPSTS